MKTYGLAYDMCRCAANMCDIKESCQRWTDKAVGGTWVPYSDFSVCLTKGANNGCERVIPIARYQKSV